MSAPRRTPRDELADATELGDVYLRRLRRSQLSLSLVALLAFGGFIGALPLALYLLQDLMDVEVLGIPLPIAVITVPVFPLLVAFGWLYARRAQSLDEAFRDLSHEP